MDKSNSIVSNPSSNHLNEIKNIKLKREMKINEILHMYDRSFDDAYFKYNGVFMVGDLKYNIEGEEECIFHTIQKYIVDMGYYNFKKKLNKLSDKILFNLYWERKEKSYSKKGYYIYYLKSLDYNDIELYKLLIS